MAATTFRKLVYTPLSGGDISLAIAANRAGGIGIFNAELDADVNRIVSRLEFIASKTSSDYGLKVDRIDDNLFPEILKFVHQGLRWLILNGASASYSREHISELRSHGLQVLAEIKSLGWPHNVPLDNLIDGLILKGNEAGGFVEESSSFILIQRWLKQTDLPLYIHGGVTPHIAAACSALGAVGGVLDNQVLLLGESSLNSRMRGYLEKLSGNETVAVGNGEEGHYFRVLVRPGFRAAQEFVAKGDGKTLEGLKQLIAGNIDWDDPEQGLLPLGQDICFAGPWARQYGHLAAVFHAIDDAVEKNLQQAVAAKPIANNAPLAHELGVPLPLVQGPMTRVSDKAEFARAVSVGGALPMLAFALLKGEGLKRLLTDTKELLRDRSWGIGLLGFAPQELLDEQIAMAKRFHPSYAIIAGGRPDQAAMLEEAGISSFLHVPSANLVSLFLQEGARRFIFEGRECGGHIGPLSSFVLWSSMVNKLLEELAAGNAVGEEIQILFAGGIHDAASSAFIQVLAAPLLNYGVKIGILMGSSYLFTKEIVEAGAIVSTFQKEVIDCDHTVNLESGPGHASRCAYTTFAQSFYETRRKLRDEKVPVDESRSILDDLIMGRLRIASKGVARSGKNGALKKLDEGAQRNEGMYMLGQVATLRAEVTDISTLHGEVTEAANKLLEARWKDADKKKEKAPAAKPADIAIIGMASLLPKSNVTQEYWENILNKVDAIEEIPRHRWDWRLYFDADRHAKDKIYSKWGGFLDDLPFDPTRYGLPPKSVESVDPMQLMALEVARRTLADAGYEDKAYNRERASIIIGASGGAGDVGMQYGLRAELPRFQGELPDPISDRLPEWTEDTFAGILINVVAGRIANRLNLGGVNFSVDAACASSLAAIYQGISELTSGRSDLVISGGVDTVQGPFGYLCFSKTQALSPQGRCRTFDAASDGIVISEGLAMIALKRLEDAERDGDRIYAVIKGVGGSSDGNAKGLTAPLPAGQLRAMRRAYQQAGFGADTVGLFEAHGTGTVAGDTAELESTTSLVKEAGGKPRQAVVGSVKTSIGHTKASAGVAGLMKASLALHHHVLPPHRGVTEPNKVLQQNDCPLYLLDEARPWLATKGIPRRAAASAFGFGGTNFHVVLEEYTNEYRPWMQQAVMHRWPAELYVWRETDSSKLAERLLETRQNLAGQKNPELNVARNLAEQLGVEGETIAIVADSRDDLQVKIDAALAHLKDKGSVLPEGIFYGDGFGDGKAEDHKLAVLFPGQGSQYTDMLREIALNFRECSDTLSQFDVLLSEAFAERYGKGSLLSDYIYPRGCYNDESRSQASRALTSTDITQPALGAVSSALWKLMHAFGLKPDMLGGHSYGEFVALYAGGYIGFESLARISETRGRAIVDTVKAAGAELGTMAAVYATREDVNAAIKDIDDVIIANHNAPQQCIISGSRQAISEAVSRLSASGISASEIPVAAAFHTPIVAPAQPMLAEVIGNTRWHKGNIPVYSNINAEAHDGEVSQIKKRMIDHLVSPVAFVDEIDAMYRDGARVFLELGPKNVLTKLVRQTLGDREHTAISIDDNGKGIKGLLAALGQLLCAGVKLDLMKLYEGRDDSAFIEPLPRDESALPKHVWMLNGSGVRKAGTGKKQVGVTADDAISVSSRPVHSEPESPAKEPRVSVPRRETAKAVTNRKQEVVKMSDRRGPPGAGESAVVAEYFETMRQFLQTQERVMAMYMGGESLREPRPSARVQRPPRQPAIAMREVIPAEMDQAEQPQPIRKEEVVVAPQRSEEQAPPAAVPIHAVESQSQPAPAETKPAPKAEEAGGYDREKMADMLLSIVEEKTGYPRDMIGLDQNLEADLGIDSIKRIEIVGAMLQALPESIGQGLADKRGAINSQAKLNGMLDILSGPAQEQRNVAVPFDEAGAGLEDPKADLLPRHIIEVKREALEESALRRLTTGHFVVTRDELGVADKIADRLQEQGCTVSLVEQEILLDEDVLNNWCASLKDEVDELAGIVHLAPANNQRLSSNASLPEWRNQLQLNEKSLFLLLRNFSDRLLDSAHVMAVSALGGLYGRQGYAHSDLMLQGGQPGVLKSLYEERPGLRVKAVDIEPNREAELITENIYGELEVVGGRQEVGYPDGVRTVFKTVATPAQVKDDDEVIRDAVIVATGGARGVTGETLRKLALPGNVLLLIGRAVLEDEPDAIKALATPEALRAHFIEEVRLGRSKMTPADIQRKIQSITAAREMRNNIADFRASGAVVEYFSLDITNEAAVETLFNDIYQQYGRIDGVVHGAGIIEDKLLAEKSAHSWSRVVETKVLGLMMLQKFVRPDSLKFFTVFSSVAGRYGNSGQSDYATANEIMNRLCGQLSAKWGDGVTVRAFCWGPWGKTKYGSGMVTAETEAKFAEKGVYLVSADVGARLFSDELLNAGNAQIEIICGEGPWEQREADNGKLEYKAMPVQDGAREPLLDEAVVKVLPSGERELSFVLGENHLYLQDHCIDGVPIVPAAVAAEMMSEAAHYVWPDWKIAETRDCRLLKGIEFNESRKELIIRIQPPVYGSSEGFDVSVFLQSKQDDGSFRNHYRATIQLVQQLPESFEKKRKAPDRDQRKLATAKAYDEWLFHGSRFQVIENIKGMSMQGSDAVVRCTSPGDWLNGIGKSQWIFDPALVDSAAQMSILWARMFRGETSLPTRFGRIVRYCDTMPEKVLMTFEQITSGDAKDDAPSLRSDVYFSDVDSGQVLLLVEDMECIASAALNRLGGAGKSGKKIIA
jgi:acyl transferase domain-containing protein/NAD(P)H-dependent flavin oxidoreductase YrpB (nitropropane dioxygenase family)/NAD(P)-dependent dehydrogenase (short-subunit alcohol dehydrogenase family)